MAEKPTAVIEGENVSSPDAFFFLIKQVCALLHSRYSCPSRRSHDVVCDTLNLEGWNSGIATG